MERRLGRLLTTPNATRRRNDRSRVALVIPAQGIDFSASNPARQLQLNILIAVAEFEREIIRVRASTRASRRECAWHSTGQALVIRKRLPKARALLQLGANISTVSSRAMLGTSNVAIRQYWSTYSDNGFDILNNNIHCVQ